MKKLWISGCILAVSLVTHAAISLSTIPEPGGFDASFDVFIISDGGPVHDIYLSLTPSVPYWVFDLSHHPDFILDDWGLQEGIHWWQLTNSIGTSTNQPIGEIFHMRLDFQLMHNGYTLDLFDANISEIEPVDSIHFPGVPEPGTVLLLGLGAVALRRRQ